MREMVEREGERADWKGATRIKRESKTDGGFHALLRKWVEAKQSGDPFFSLVFASTKQTAWYKDDSDDKTSVDPIVYFPLFADGVVSASA